MVRDLRDVFCSMEKNFRKNPEKASPLVDWSKMQGTTIPKRIDLWANGVPVGMALERLSEIIRLGTDKHMLFIKYEDLCMYPDAEMTKIYKFFELEYFEHDFDNIEQATKEDDEVYGVFGDHTIRQKLEPMQSQAKAVLGKDVCDWIYNNYAWFYQYFGYKK
jgi:sulfotransferase